MEPTYTVLGGDGKQYGPITAEQFAAWAREGRVNGDTQVLPSDATAWQPASQIAVLGVAPGPGIQVTAVPTPAEAALFPPAVAPAHASVDPAIDRRIKNGASWFYWIAALSMVNSVVALTGSNWRFIIGLGITQVFDGVASSFGTVAKVVALGLDAIVAALFVLFGVFAHKRQSWAFIIGMILFGLDGILTGIFQDWISLAFHAFALFVIFKAYQAARTAA